MERRALQLGEAPPLYKERLTEYHSAASAQLTSVSSALPSGLSVVNVTKLARSVASDGSSSSPVSGVTLLGRSDDVSEAKRAIDTLLEANWQEVTIDAAHVRFDGALEDKLSAVKRDLQFKVDIRAIAAQKIVIVRARQAAIGRAAIETQRAILNLAAKQIGVSLPPFWDDSASDDALPVVRGSPEWQHVENRFKRGFSCIVNKIERVQKTKLWKAYDMQRKLIADENNGDVNERELIHGTSGKDPSCIYNGVGFHLNYCQDGYFGRAHYFAQQTMYSDRGYAFKLPDGQRRMLLVVVAVGKTEERTAIDTTIKHPALGCHSVHATLANDPLYDAVMIYDNDRAYPLYVVTYTPN